MGGEESNQIRQNDQYTEIRRIEDIRYGTLTICKDSKGSLYLKREVMTKVNSETKNIRKRLNFRRKIACPNLIKILKIDQKTTQKMLCTTFKTLKIYTRFYENNLQKEFTRRKKQDLYYTEAELYKLLKALINAGLSLHDHELMHGDFRAHNVFIDDQGQYIITDYAAFGLDYSQFTEFLQKKNSDCTLAPEQMMSMQKNEINQNDKSLLERQRIDVFQAGMLMLQAATLQVCYEVYDWDYLLIKPQKIAKLIQVLTNKYSCKFIQTIQKMLVINPVKRISFKQAKSEIWSISEQLIFSNKQFKGQSFISRTNKTKEATGLKQTKNRQHTQPMQQSVVLNIQKPLSPYQLYTFNPALIQTGGNLQQPTFQPFKQCNNKKENADQNQDSFIKQRQSNRFSQSQKSDIKFIRSIELPDDKSISGRFQKSTCIRTSQQLSLLSNQKSIMQSSISQPKISMSISNQSYFLKLSEDQRKRHRQFSDFNNNNQQEEQNQKSFQNIKHTQKPENVQNQILSFNDCDFTKYNFSKEILQQVKRNQEILSGIKPSEPIESQEQDIKNQNKNANIEKDIIPFRGHIKTTIQKYYKQSPGKIKTNLFRGEEELEKPLPCQQQQILTKQQQHNPLHIPEMPLNKQRLPIQAKPTNKPLMHYKLKPTQNILQNLPQNQQKQNNQMNNITKTSFLQSTTVRSAKQQIKQPPLNTFQNSYQTKQIQKIKEQLQSLKFIKNSLRKQQLCNEQKISNKENFQQFTTPISLKNSDLQNSYQSYQYNNTISNSKTQIVDKNTFSPINILKNQKLFKENQPSKKHQQRLKKFPCQKPMKKFPLQNEELDIIYEYSQMKYQYSSDNIENQLTQENKQMDEKVQKLLTSFKTINSLTFNYQQFTQKEQVSEKQNYLNILKDLTDYNNERQSIREQSILDNWVNENTSQNSLTFQQTPQKDLDVEDQRLYDRLLSEYGQQYNLSARSNLK